jgi:hypothetical protein
MTLSPHYKLIGKTFGDLTIIALDATRTVTGWLRGAGAVTPARSIRRGSSAASIGRACGAMWCGR